MKPIEDSAKSSKSKRASKSRSKKTESRNGNNHTNSTSNTYQTGYSTGTSPTTPTVNDPQIGSSDAAKVCNLKSFVGFDPQTVRTFHSQMPGFVDLSLEVCERIAEDASYTMWELADDIKIYARHSGNVVNYDLVNEVLEQSGDPPMLGAMDTEFERGDTDESFYFYADKIVELHEDYQKDVYEVMSDGIDLTCYCPINSALTVHLQKFVPSLLYATLIGNKRTHNAAISMAATTPVMAYCYRLVLSKIIEQLAFKQSDEFSERCWRVLRSCTVNPYANKLNCRKEYFNLAEILICQLLAPNEKIKEPAGQAPLNTTLKMETDGDFNIDENYTQEFKPDVGVIKQSPPEAQDIRICLQADEDDTQLLLKSPINSLYFSSPVQSPYVDELCKTIGHLGAQNGYMMTECLYQINRRLERLFSTREVFTERDYSFLGRALRGLQALGEYAFREFIPYIYKIPVDEIPDSLWRDLVPTAAFLKGRDDIFLYEWLAYGCGADCLQPYLTFYSRAQEKFAKERALQLKRRLKIIPKCTGVRRFEWNRDTKGMKRTEIAGTAKPSVKDFFPKQRSIRARDGPIIHFKFTGCRPTLPKSYSNQNKSGTLLSSILVGNNRSPAAKTTIVVGRKIFKRTSNLACNWNSVSNIRI